MKKQWSSVASIALVFAVFSACSNGNSSSSAENDDVAEIESDSSEISSESTDPSSSSKKQEDSSDSESEESSSSDEDDDSSSSSSSKDVSSSSKNVYSSSSYTPENIEDFDLVTCKTEGLISYYLKNKGEVVERVCHDGLWVEVESSSSVAPTSSNGGTPSTCTVEHYDMDEQFNPDVKYKEFTDSRDGKKYKTVQIEKSVSFEIFAENLNYGVQVQGLNSEFDDDKTEKYCLEDDSWYCDNGFGGLYTWSEAMGLPKACDTVSVGSTTECPNPLAEGMNSNADWAVVQVQGICPNGWHIMNELEWTTLAGGTYVGDLISRMFGNGDDYGFSALLGGVLNSTGKIEYELAPKYGFMWLPQESGSITAHSIAFTRSLWDSSFKSLYKTNGLSIRCVKNYKAN
ncbi:FISUMP domain-containing protein [Fibrobacter succinogenes]|uniref:FISUMP domain-containing protein n=1 Tax=Fibrobacter succinogenes TaxID=833 RepID=UPI0013D7ACA4|nr:FISUMP domain-containing protein [Fibrobacter succinogenes]